MEALASRDGSIIPLEAPGNRGRGIPGKPGPWTLQWEEVEQGWCQSQKRPRGAKSPWGSRGGAPSEGDRTCLPGSMDVMGPGIGVTAIMEGTVADRSREVELSPALGDWPAANTKKRSKDLGRRGRPIMQPMWSSLLYTEPYSDWLSKCFGRRAVQMEARQGPHGNRQMGGTAASQSQ